MRFKEIKPGMVIHCPKGEDARALLEHLNSLGYVWDNFRRDKIDSDAHYEIYKENTCYKISMLNKAITYGEQCYESKVGYAITEFSDLIELEPDIEFEVKDCGDTITSTITEHGKITSELSEQIEPEANKANDLANSLDNQDNNLDNQRDNEMSAVEVLEWLEQYGGTQVAEKVFGFDSDGYVVDAGNVLDIYSPQEIVDKIIAYEAAKKAPKPAEVKWADFCRIIQIQDNGVEKCVYEEDVSNTPTDNDLKGICEDILKKYISVHDGKYFATITHSCRVKEDK